MSDYTSDWRSMSDTGVQFQILVNSYDGVVRIEESVLNNLMTKAGMRCVNRYVMPEAGRMMPEAIEKLLDEGRQD